MNELYQLIETKIKASGYLLSVNGDGIYDEINNFIEDKDNGTYLFLSKNQHDHLFEYKLDVFEENFNLSYLKITSPEGTYYIDFDA